MTGVVGDDARPCISLIAEPLKRAIKHNVALKPGLAGLCGISMAGKINRCNIVARRAAPDLIAYRGLKGLCAGACPLNDAIYLRRVAKLDEP